MGKVETIAKAIYDSHEFVKPWEHPDTQRLWRVSCMRSALAVLKALRGLK